LVEIRTESRRLGARSPNWKQRGSRPAATGWDYQEAMVGSARRGGLIRRGPGGGGASRTRTWTERGRTEVRARILGFRLWSLHGILDWAMRRAVSLPPSLSSVSDTQLASRNPTFAASQPGRAQRPSIHQARCGQRTGRSFAVGPTGPKGAARFERIRKAQGSSRSNRYPRRRAP
jgi:hypothetical protein